jgi:hypothetical protein
MRTKPAWPDLVQVARPNPLDVDGRPAIPQDDLNPFRVSRAGYVDRPARIPQIGVFDDVGAGFIHSENDPALILFRTFHQIAKAGNHVADDNEKSRI